jgi:hypothetical protein
LFFFENIDCLSDIKTLTFYCNFDFQPYNLEQFVVSIITLSAILYFQTIQWRHWWSWWRRYSRWPHLFKMINNERSLIEILVQSRCIYVNDVKRLIRNFRGTAELADVINHKSWIIILIYEPVANIFICKVFIEIWEIIFKIINLFTIRILSNTHKKYIIYIYTETNKVLNILDIRCDLCRKWLIVHLSCIMFVCHLVYHIRKSCISLLYYISKSCITSASY